MCCKGATYRTSERERERAISAEGKASTRRDGRKRTERARYDHGLVSGITDGVRRPSRVNTVARPEPLILLRLSRNHCRPRPLPFLRLLRLPAPS